MIKEEHHEGDDTMTAHNSDPALVLAWEVVDVYSHSANSSDVISTYYCQTIDGRIFTTGPRLETPEIRVHFSVKSDTWTEVEALPTRKSFIGTYHKPDQIA
jgi:hypothetical protein